MSEVETSQSQDGFPILKVEGRLTASRVAPWREAEKLVQQWSEQLQGSNSVILLGLASGFHVVEFMKRDPKLQILVIERRSELLEFFAKTFSAESKKIQVLLGEDFKSLSASAHLRSIVQKSYRVFMHPSLQGKDLEFYSEIYEDLLGRSPLGLKFLVQQRKSLSALIQLEKLLLIKDSRRPLSLKTLVELERDDVGQQIESRKLHFLRELIK